MPINLNLLLKWRTVSVFQSRSVAAISATNDNSALDDSIDFLQVILVQLYLNRVLLDPLLGRGTWNGDQCRIARLLALLDDPLGRKLSRSTALLLGNLLNVSHKLHILVKDIWLKAWLRLAA